MFARTVGSAWLVRLFAPLLLLLGLMACQRGGAADAPAPTLPPPLSLDDFPTLTTAPRLEVVTPMPALVTVTTVPPSETPLPTEEPTATATETVTPTPGPVSSLEEVSSAIIQIEAHGAFYDYQFTDYTAVSGRGSGFIIDRSGLAITNNHVVGGAAYIDVWVGEERTPRRATLLGASECDDLALIQIEGSEFPYLEWDTAAPRTGESIIAAGFPWGEPTYTLSRGIITQAPAAQSTEWADVISVLTHDARIAPGSSGGPLLSQAARVVGINYAANPYTEDSFAIAAAAARPLVAELQQGRFVDSIGVNGFAVSQYDARGIAIIAVRAGSPADHAGLRGGQLIERIDEFPMARDGTMREYCETIRAHRGNLRFNLTVKDVLSDERSRVVLGDPDAGAAPEPPVEAPPSAQETPPPPGWDRLVDSWNAIQVDVPSSWNQRDTTGWLRDADGELYGAAIDASPDLAGMRANRNVPGLFFGATSSRAATESPLSMLDAQKAGQMGEHCTFVERQPYDDNYYVGYVDRYVQCGGGDIGAYVISAWNDGESVLLLLINFVPTNQEGDDLHMQIRRSFFVIGTPP